MKETIVKYAIAILWAIAVLLLYPPRSKREIILAKAELSRSKRLYLEITVTVVEADIFDPDSWGQWIG